MWIERLMAGISHQHVLSYNPKNDGREWLSFSIIKKHILTLLIFASECASYFLQSQIFYPGILYYASAVSPSSASSSSTDA